MLLIRTCSGEFDTEVVHVAAGRHTQQVGLRRRLVLNHEEALQGDTRLLILESDEWEENLSVGFPRNSHAGNKRGHFRASTQQRGGNPLHTVREENK